MVGGSYATIRCDPDGAHVGGYCVSAGTYQGIEIVELGAEFIVAVQVPAQVLGLEGEVDQVDQGEL